MTLRLLSGHGKLVAALVILSGAGTAALIKNALASDHQDTPEVELNPRLDINDVYVFPGSSSDRLVLVQDRKSTRLNSSHSQISYAVFCLKKKKKICMRQRT